MDGRRVICIEFNELCPRLLESWMAEGKLPNFKRFYDASQVLTGLADVTDEKFLEPWIQWYSLHTGLSYDQHGVFHLTDGPAAGHTDIWHALLDAGLTVGNCAGMNAGAFAKPGSFYLPDPWCSTEPPYPPELAAYQRVVVTKVQENSNSGTTLSRKDYANFVSFLVRNGLRSTTVLAVVEQLMAERRGPNGWKRAALLDRLQLDVFLSYWKRMTPDFSSFFINSTAHFQHAYFHLLEPGAFNLPADELHDPVHQDAVAFGYQQMDRILGDFMALEQQGVMLMLSTALSQQPNEDAGRRYYRPRDASALLTRLGIDATTLLPVMAQQYSAAFADAASTEAARAALQQVTLNGHSVFGFDDAPANTLFFGPGMGGDIAADAQVDLGNGTTAPFFDLFYRVPHMKTGIHHPDSALWIKTGTHHVHPGHTSILNIYPTLMEYYGVTATPGDGKVRTGHSIAGQVGMGRYARALTPA